MKIRDSNTSWACTAMISVEENPCRLNLPNAPFEVSTRYAHLETSTLQSVRWNRVEVCDSENHGYKIDCFALRTCESPELFAWRSNNKTQINSHSCQSEISRMASNVNHIWTLYRSFLIEWEIPQGAFRVPYNSDHVGGIDSTYSIGVRLRRICLHAFLPALNRSE
jgi:hypothetical protein